MDETVVGRRATETTADGGGRTLSPSEVNRLTKRQTTVVLDRLGGGLYDPCVPIQVERDQRRRWIIVRATGCLAIPEILTLIQTARADVEHRMWPMLFDAPSATTEATELDVDRAVAGVRRATEQQGLRGHVAIVANDDRLFARALLYEARCADIGVRLIRVFRQREDAERWLEIVSASRHFV